MAMLRDLVVTESRELLIDSATVEYTAAPVSLLAPTPAQAAVFVAGDRHAKAVAVGLWATTRLARFMASVDGGARRVRERVTQSLRRCPDRKLVLTGYSQGAMAVHRALVGLSRDGESEKLRKIAAVGLLADGDRTANSAAVSVGSAVAGAKGVAVFGLAKRADIPRQVAGRTYSYCTDNDIVCDATLGNLRRFGRGGDIHSSYSKSDLSKLAAKLVKHLPKPAYGVETGQVTFTHPTWGTSTFITSLVGAGSGTARGHMRVRDSAGRVRWHAVTQPKFNWYEMGLNDPAVDATGQIFVNWNPGRYNGVTVLRPVAGGMEDHDTLPEPTYDSRFYYSDVVDVDGDGVFEIEKHHNDCDPDCAGGTITTTTWFWDGTGYVDYRVLSAQTAAAFVGTWSGPISQPGSPGYSNATTLTFDGQMRGTVSYPGLGCSGTLSKFSLDGISLLATETITSDPARTCVSVVELRFTPRSDGTLYYETLDGYDATGTLTRS